MVSDLNETIFAKNYIYNEQLFSCYSFMIDMHLSEFNRAVGANTTTNSYYWPFCNTALHPLRNPMCGGEFLHHNS